MGRIALALASLLLVAMPAASAPAERQIEAGRLGRLPVLLPEGNAKGLVFLFSDQAGWNADLDRAARRLSGLGAAVLEVDLPGYLARLRQSDDADCHYLISEIENTSKRLQRELGLEHYRSPVLAGTGMGSALVYAALAQSPAATVAGAASDGLSTRLDTRVPLCPGAPSAAAGAGFEYRPKADLPGWWRIALPPDREAAGRDFVAGIAQAQIVAVRPGADLADRLAALLGPPLTDAKTAASTIEGLPLVELPADKPGDLLAVFYSGDGGWRDIDKQIGGILAAQGIATVGVDSLRYFWKKKSPQQIAGDLTTILRHYRAQWGRDRAILLGYSFGANILPFAVNRLAPAERAMIRQISMLGLEKITDFEFHVTDWLGVGGGADSRPVLPEVARLDPKLLQCFYGEEESDTACTAPAFDRAERIETAGGHHFDGDYAALADKIMAGARRRTQT